MSLDGFSLYPLARNLNAQLAGGRIDRIFQPNKHTILLLIRQPGKNITLHISINPQCPGIYFIERTIENPPVPPLFCMVLRKQIEDGRIAAVTQCGLDRMLTIEIDTIGVGGKIITKTLIIELMGKYSNIILTEDRRIIDAMRKIGSNENRVRQILPGKEYQAPPAQDKLNVLLEPLSRWVAELKKQDGLTVPKAIIRATLGLGPVSANEITWRAGLPLTILIDDLDTADFQSLTAAMEEILTSFHDNTLAPTAVLDSNRKLVAIAAFPLNHLQNHLLHSFTSLSQMMDFAASAIGSYTPPDKERLKKLIASESTKSHNKQQRLAAELEQAHHAEDYKIKGDILMTYQYQLTDLYQTAVELPDIYSNLPEENKLTISLDPLLTPMQNTQKYYQKYNKLKRAQESLLIQLEQCENDIRYLDSIENSVKTSTTLQEINEIKAELVATGYLKETARKRPQEKPSQPLKLSFEGTTILVGKNNYQNDRLTFKLSDPFDIWLHVKDIPGSHVIVRCNRQQPEEKILRYAAEIAAYFSKASTSSNVPVDYTQRRYVKKPSGAKPGFVIYTDQKTLYVTPDAATIEKNLAK